MLISIVRLTFVNVAWVGSGVPGPPRVPIIMRPISCGAAGLIEATSNVGEAGVWADDMAHRPRVTITIRSIWTPMEIIDDAGRHRKDSDGGSISLFPIL